MFTTALFSSRKTCAVISSLLLALLFAQCSSFSSMDDFRRAREQASRGEGRAVVSKIMGDIDDMNPSMHGVAVDTVAVVEGPEARDALLAMLDKPALRAPETRERIINHLIRRDDPGTADELYARYQKDPSFLTGEVVEYFGSQRYTPAIGDIKAVINQGRFVDEGIRALSMMREGDAEKFVLAVADAPGTRGRAEAIRSLPRLMHPYYKKNAHGLIRQLITQKDPRDRDDYLAALQAAGGLGMQTDFFDILKNVHTTSKDAAVRAQALESMARMKGVDSYLMSRDLQLPLAEKQSMLSVWKGEQEGKTSRTYRRRVSGAQPAVAERPTRQTTRNSRAKKPVRPAHTEKPAPAALADTTPLDSAPEIPGPRRAASDEPKTEKPAQAPAPEAGDAEGRAYRAKVVETLSSVTPPNVANALAQRIHNAFMSYADFNTPSAQFIVRSYQKAFGGDEAHARRLLTRGLTQPGSLGAVIRNVKAEYASEEMRIYVLSNLFALPRWQASVLLEQSEKNFF